MAGRASVAAVVGGLLNVPSSRPTSGTAGATTPTGRPVTLTVASRRPRAPRLSGGRVGRGRSTGPTAGSARVVGGHLTGVASRPVSDTSRRRTSP